MGSPAKRSRVFYLLLSNDESIVGRGVATAGIAAADCRYLVLHQQISAAAAAVGVAAAAGGGTDPPVGTKAIGTGRSCGKIVRVVGTCGSWAIAHGIQKKKKCIYSRVTAINSTRERSLTIVSNTGIL